MRVEFRQGVPQECIDWLWENVGQGNVQPKMTGPLRTFPAAEHDAWFYERITMIKPPQGFDDDSLEHVPTITVKDPKLAVLFTLRWA